MTLISASSKLGSPSSRQDTKKVLDGVLAKLHAADCTEAIAAARRAGIKLKGGMRVEGPGGREQLTDEDVTILKFLADDWEEQKIAEYLGIADDELKQRLGRIRLTLAASTNLGAVVEAIRRGLIGPGPASQ